jgi:acyl transferase domain-containing protein
VAGFDAEFFGISPHEAAWMDPQQRLFLEVCWEALERAGIPVRDLAGSATGVFVGAHTHSSDYYLLQLAQPGEVDGHSSPGAAHSILANRVSYLLDLRGPSLAIDTACSSSLVAVHQACQSLRAGETDLAIAGGVNLILLEAASEAIDRLGILAPDDVCRTFDAGANGTARGEGIGAVILKRLADATRDGDPILAVIRGSAVNQDGASNGLTAPNGTAQVEVIRRALANGGLEGQQLHFVEAHGTGTALGDPIEVGALTEVMRGGRRDGAPCWLGAVKTNLGHLEAAAGIAGLIKAVLCLQHRAVPPNLHFEQLNPQIDLTPARLALPGRLEPLPETGPLFAGLSSFGFGGTNAHLSLESAPTPEPRREPASRPEWLVLPLSARSPGALRALADRWIERLAALPDDLTDLVATAAVRRSHESLRLAAIGRDAAELARDLERRCQELALSRVERRPGLAFIYSGQGTQWAGMGRELFEREPTFRDAVQAMADAYRRVSGQDPLPLLLDETAELADTIAAQPAILLMQVGLTALLRSWGIVPDAVAGHSVGEIAAAHAAGMLSADDAARVVWHRARLMQEIPRGGRMLQVALPEAELVRVMGEIGNEVDIAALNAPNATVLSGPAAAVERAATELGRRSIQTQALPVEYGFHSRMVAAAAESLAPALRGLAPSAPSIPILSTVTGDWAGAEAFGAEYWARNVREPVRLAPAVERLAAGGHTVFVEIGPHPALGGSLASTAGPGTVITGSLRRQQPAGRALRQMVASVYEAGIDPTWRALAPAVERVAPLPGYPWQRRPYWLGDGDGVALAANVLGTARRPGSSICYEVQWTAAPAAATTSSLGGGWLLVGSEDALRAAVAEELQRQGENVIVRPVPDRADPAAWTALVAHTAANLGARWKGMVYLAPPLHDEPDGAAAVTVEAAAAALALRAKGTPGSRFWIVTRGAQAVADGESAQPVQASLWGLGRSLALETPELWGGIIDLAPEDPTGAGAAVASALGAPNDDDQMALRGGALLVPRLVPAAPPGVRPAICRPEATYLVTGAFGGLGPKVIQWLVRAGAKHLALVGRSGLPPREAWPTLSSDSPAGRAVAAIESAARDGVQCHPYAADVADREAMQRIFTEAASAGRPVRGIIHAAAAIRPAPLEALDRQTVDEAFRGKVAGAHTLHELTRDGSLDFFVLFSSGAATLGAKHWAPYAAANQYLVALAAQRRQAGLPALAIDWGAWDEIRPLGAQSTDEMRELGFLPLEDESAFDLVAELIGAGTTHRFVARLDVGRMHQAYELARPRPILERLTDTTATAEESLPTGVLSELATAQLDPAEALALIEQHIRDAAAAVLGLESGVDLDPERGLFDLGMDSLMAMRFRSRIERLTGLPLPATLVFNYPTASAVARHLAERLGVGAAPVSAPVASDEEVRAMLLAELDALGGGVG